MVVYCSIFVKFNKKNLETKSFKKRYCIGYKNPSLIFGNYSFLLCKSYNIEYLYIYNFRRGLKKYFNFKKNSIKKIWLFLHKNYPLTKKSKNSRMGKGKGGIVRYCSRILQNHNIFEFCGFNIYDLLNLKKIFLKKIHIPIVILKKNFPFAYVPPFQYGPFSPVIS